MTVSIDIKELTRVLNNAVEYSIGFATEIQRQRARFMRQLGELVVNLMGDYIDAKAGMDPESLHHVYEWGRAGDKAARLYDFDLVTTLEAIHITGTFRISTSEPPSGGTPFADKAVVMENGAAITIVPKEGGVLAFEDDGESVVISSSVTVQHPGGPAVAGSFEAAVNEFITGYINLALIQPLLNDMATPEEYVRHFPAGTRMGYKAGQTAGRQYMDIGETYDGAS